MRGTSRHEAVTGHRSFVLHQERGFALSVTLPNGVHRESDVMWRMRDGTRLACDVYRSARSEGSVPVLLMRTPYDKANAQANDVLSYAHPSWYAARGYIVVVQDVRGRYKSEGMFRALLDEAEDGYDTIEHCIQLEGADPAVGMYGMSYGGYVQFAAESLNHPALKCMVPGCITPRLSELWTYKGLPRTALLWGWALSNAAAQALREGEAEDYARLFGWAANAPAVYHSTPILEAPEFELVERYFPFFREVLTREPGDIEFWQPFQVHVPRVPALYVAGYFDTWALDLVEVFNEHVRVDPRARLLYGPWAHLPWRHALTACGPSEAGDPDPSVNELHRQWFDWWLKGVKPSSWLADVPACWFDYGDMTWQSGDLESADRQEYLFAGDGLGPAGARNALVLQGATEDRPPAQDTSAKWDVIIDNPNTPTASVGGWSCCYGAIAPIGPRDQAEVESSGQVIVYTSDEFEGGTQFLGNASIRVPIVAEWLPTTLIATLCLVRDGRSVNLARGLWRGLSETQEAWVETEAHITLSPAAIRFRDRDRLRLLLQSSSFPELAPDPHVPGPVATVGREASRISSIFIKTGRDGVTLSLPVSSPSVARRTGEVSLARAQ